MITSTCLRLSRAFGGARTMPAISRKVVGKYATLRPFTTPASETADYESPLQDLFEQMEKDVTSLGTTAPIKHEMRTLDCGVPEDALRFMTTSYGRLLNAPHVHPNEHRVTMKVGLRHLPLDEIETEILKEIVGARVEGDQLRLSSNQFASRIENKRHLVSMLERIVSSCKSLGKELQE